MKKRVLAGLALFFTFSLFAQMRDDISIFVPPVTGTGSGPDDLIYFTDMTQMEVPARGFALSETQSGADYIIRGSISPYTPEYEEPEELGEDEELVEIPEDSYYALHVALIDNQTEYVMVEQDLIYQVLEETNEYFPVLIFNMLANIPLSKLTYDDNWRHKWLYIGGYVNWSPRIYTGTLSAAYMAGFGLGVSTEFHFLNFMSLETGLEINEDSVASQKGIAARGLVVEVPALLKIVLKPSLHYMLEPYGGIQINGPTSREIMPPLVSWLAGFQFGVRAGGGVFFIDARFIRDIGESTMFPDAPSEQLDYQRMVIKFNLGYKFGFVNRSR
jgi:hypothetical protein